MIKAQGTFSLLGGIHFVGVPWEVGKDVKLYPGSQCVVHGLV